MFVALVLELRLFAPGRQPTERQAVVWSIGWLAFASGVVVAIAVAGGPVGEWSTVYLIERSLSLDNVFLFSLLLVYFAVPPSCASGCWRSASWARSCCAASRSWPASR